MRSSKSHIREFLVVLYSSNLQRDYSVSKIHCRLTLCNFILILLKMQEVRDCIRSSSNLSINRVQMFVSASPSRMTTSAVISHSLINTRGYNTKRKCTYLGSCRKLLLLQLGLRFLLAFLASLAFTTLPSRHRFYNKRACMLQN